MTPTECKLVERVESLTRLAEECDMAATKALMRGDKGPAEAGFTARDLVVARIERWRAVLRARYGVVMS